MLQKIISGGQTGADRAALDAALAVGFPAGGCCPKGRLAEDGPIDRRYPLTEISGGYQERTLQNVLEGDGTLIFYESRLSGGTELTLAFCIQHARPYQLIDTALVSEPRAIEAVCDFVRDCKLVSLNVAGPRASRCPRISDYVYKVISGLLGD